MNIKEVNQEIGLIVEIERNEVGTFKRMMRKSLQEIEESKSELKIKEEINLNISFIHHRLKAINKLLHQILFFAKEIKNGKKGSMVDLQLQLKTILNCIFEVEDLFFPAVSNNLGVLMKEQKRATKLVENMKKKVEFYKDFIEKLKKVLNLADISIRDWKKLKSIKTKKIKVRIM